MDLKDGKLLNFNEAKARRAAGNGIPPTNWLKELEVGTCFRARPRDPKYVDAALVEYEVESQGERSTKLVCMLRSGPEWMPVDTERFSHSMECVEILGKVVSE